MKTENNQSEEKPGADTNVGGPSVEFLDLNTNNEVRFQVHWKDTLKQAWEKAYKELKEVHTAEDVLLCSHESASLMDHLSLTFEQMRERKICSGHKYRIRRPTGGA